MVLLARTIDKVRATLPGGNIGPYNISGFSSHLLEMLGITEEALREKVASAENEAEVVEWVHAHSNPAAYAAFNAEASAPTVGERLDRPAFVEKYPLAKTLPPETTLFEMLEYDDCDSFLQ